MNEQALNYSYELFRKDGYTGTIDQYKQLLDSDKKAFDYSYNLFKSDGYSGSLDDFSSLIGSSVQKPILQEIKKKPTDSISEDGSLGLSESTPDPEALRFAELALEQEGIQDFSLPAPPIKGKRIDEEGYVDPRSKLSMYPTKDQSDRATSQYFSDLMESKGMDYVPTEKDYFQGGFGEVLRGLDQYLPIPIGDIIDDTARAVAVGYNQGQLSSAGLNLTFGGKIPSDEDIESLIKYNEKVRELGVSDEFLNYQKVSEEAGGGVFGFFRGIAKEPTVLPEVLINSLVSMATNKESIITGASAILANATATAAAAGAPTAGAGAIPGFAVGAVSAVPVAFGLASGIVTTGATFAELLQNELEGKDFTKENIKEILEDPKKFNSIKNKAIIKGATIGAIDIITGKLATSVGAKILSKSAAKSATGEATKGAVTKALGATSVVEGGGGGIGEFAGTAAIGEKQDVENILFEIFTDLPGAAVATASSRFAKPVYKVNGESVSATDVDKLIETMTGSELSVANIKIENDYEGRNFKIQDKIITSSIANEIKSVQPDLNESTVNAIVDLQKQLNKLEGNKTQVAKDKAVQIRAEIRDLQSNPIPDTVTQETPTYKVGGKDVTADVIDELISTKSREELLAMDIQINNDTEGRVDRFQEVIGTKPVEQDAIQEQAAGQVPVQEAAEGAPQVEPEVVTQEVKEKIDKLEAERKKELLAISQESEGMTDEELAETSGERIAKRVEVEERYDTEIANIRNQTVQTQQEVETLRAQEQAELTEALTDADQYMVDGVIDGEKITDPAEKKIFDEIYDKYDKLISPLIEAQATTEAVVQEDVAPVAETTVKAKEPKPKVISEKKKREEIISRTAFTPTTLARQWLLSGGKLLSKQSERNKARGVGIGKGVREETGMSGIEMKQLFGVIDNKRGVPIEVAAEMIHADLNPELQSSIDVQDIRNAMIDVISSEDRKTWIENQDRETSENQMSESDQFMYDQLNEQERADFDEYQQVQDYNDYLDKNADQLAKEYDSYINSEEYKNYIEEIYGKDRESQKDAQDQDDGRGKKQSTDEGSASVQKAKQTTEIEGKLDELLKLDPKEKGTGQKVLDYLDNLIKDYDSIEGEGLGVNIALPAIKAVLKTVRALVKTGMTLKDAISKAAKDNGFSVKDVMSGIEAVGQILPIQEKYDALMNKADALISKQKTEGISDKKIVSNLDAMIRKSEVYKNANDAQRKIMEREARFKVGVEPRKSASSGRVLGVLKDITNVSPKEKLRIIGRIRELSRDVAKDLASDVRDLAKGGKITPTQAANIVSRLGKVNMLNEVSVSNFVDYMAKVFADADYDNKINVAKGKLKTALKNISTKIGIADGLVMPLNRLFSINPSLIPETKLSKYLKLLDMFSAKQAVLTLDEKSSVQKDVDDILREIDIEQSRVAELAEVFNESNERVFDDGKLDYAASLKKMLNEEQITESDLAIMKKYKQDILSEVDSETESKETVDKKKLEQISELKKLSVNSTGLPTRDEKVLANRLAKLISNTSQADLMSLGLTELKNIAKIADNINNNYLPHLAQIMVEKIEAIKFGKALANAIKRARALSFSKLYARAKKAIIRSQRSSISEMGRRNPLFNIDQVFGNFKSKDIFNSLFEKAAEGEAKFKFELKKVQSILDRAEARVANSFKLDPDAILESKFKMMTYMIQLEFDSNKGNAQVNPAIDYINATIKHIDSGKSMFGEREAGMLQKIAEDFEVNGQIDADKTFDSFNQAEKDAIKDIRGINESLKNEAQYTAAIIRGDAIDPLNNYVHLNVLHDTQPQDVSASTDFINQSNNSRRPTTKAKSLIARTRGAKPLNFDVFTSAQRGAKFVLMDYNLTEPIRTARRTLNQATKYLETDGRIPKEQRDIFNAIESAFEETLENLLTNSIIQSSIGDQAVDFISKQGYRAVLAGTGRFVAELTSNVSFALLSDPQSFMSGFKYKDVVMSTDAPEIMNNVNSKQTVRLFPSDTLSGKFIDTSIMSQRSGMQSKASKNPVFNKMNQVYNLTLKKYKNSVELIADTLISTPDKIVMRPVWFGAFANEFKKVSGKDVDFKKIANNDKTYIDANKDAIEQSKKLADEKSVLTGATDNSFMGILKGTVKPNQSLSTRAFNNFNNYMSRFLIFEYISARTAIYAVVGDGSISKTEGAALLAAVATRMTVYTLLSQMLANGIMGIFGFGDDDEEDEKSFMKKVGQALFATFSSLLLGRDFGNATKSVINYGVESINENYLDFLREGDYDPYKDGIAFSIIPRDKRKDDDLGNLIMNMTGSFAPAANSANLIYKNAMSGSISAVMSGDTTKKDADAIEREERVVKERIPLELLGNLGFIPLYKDVRKAVNKSIYSSIVEAEKASDLKKITQDDLLGGYDTKGDLKRYNPKLYEKNFGENSEWFKSTKEDREEKERESKEARKIKDRMYNYSPKEDGFGSSGFDKDRKKKSSKDGFGSKGFDKN